MTNEFISYYLAEIRKGNYEVKASQSTGKTKDWYEHRARMEAKEMESLIEYYNSKGLDTSPLTASVDDICDDELLALLSA